MKRYIVKFTKLDKNVKKLKMIKLKKPFYLVEAEQLLKSVYSELGSLELTHLTLSLEILEEESDQVFEFDRLLIDFKEEQEALISVVVVEDIYKSMEQATEEDLEVLEELADDLQKQLEEELADPSAFPSMESKRFSFPLFQKQKAESHQEATKGNQEPYNSSWEDAVPNKVEPLKEKEAPISNETPLKAEVEFESIPQVDQVDVVFEDLEPMPTLETKEDKNSKETAEKKQQKKEYQARVNGSYSTPSQKQSPTILSSLENYSDLSINGTSEAVEVILETLKEQSNKEEDLLFDHFNLKEPEEKLSLLEQKKKAYLKTIKQPNFMLVLVSNFEKNVRSLENKASQQLIGKFQAIKEVTPEEAIVDKVAESRVKAAEKAQNKLLEAKKVIEQEQAHETKQLETRHENEQKKLALQQNNERELLDQRFQQKKLTEEELIKEKNTEVIREEVHEKEQEYLQNELQKREEDLLLFKKQILEGFSRGLQDIITAVKETQESYYDDLEARLQENEEKWMAEVSSEQALQLKKAEQDILEEANRLKQEELNILQEAKEKEGTRMKTKDDLLEDLLESNERLQKLVRLERRDNQEFQETVQDQLKELKNPHDVQPMPQPIQEADVQPIVSVKKKRRFLLPLVVSLCGLSLMGTAGYVGYSEVQAVQSQNKALQQSIDQLKKEKKATDQAAEKEKEASEEKRSLAILLKEGRYIEAAEEYPEQLNEVEAQLFKDNRFNQLTAFNVLYPSINGPLDQAILENNHEKIIQAYESHEKKETLTKDQQKAIALAYFAVGNTEKGNQVLNGGK